MRAPRVVISIFDHPAYPGGGQVVVRRIIETLARDYEVVLVTAGSPVDHAGMRAGVRVVSLPVGWAGPRLGQLLYHPLLVLAALFLRHDLWIESFTPPFSSSFLPVVTGRPVVGLAQTLSAREMARKYRLAFLLRIERFALRRYGHVVVFNPYDRQLVSDCNPRASVRLIPNVLTMPAEPPAGPGAEDFCLFLGRLDITQKGLDLLADAYAGAAPGTLPLVIAGSGTRLDEHRLGELMRPHAERVRLVGHVAGERKAALLTGAAFVVMPSRDETFGLVALEAMAHGKPVVHFDVPQLSWIPADCGVKVPAFDAAALAGAVGELSRDGARRAELGRNARAFTERHNAVAASDAYADLVGEILTR
ncbi:glycosyltransferase family 4 protein [Actinoplanes sp. URMC 104]|uniref:glycosyltransferase family 4 protein n=1 Tax=Actinoplanes sp. URMC 104 TaxID=3423409 RepID=UPI003F19A9AE